jgi:adenylate cyclase
VTAGARILVVDDNEDNLYTLTERLRREGYADLVTAGDGAVALARLAAEPFDLVLLDVMMPVLDGIDTLARIKSDPELRHIPVIMISAASDQARVVRCLELGAEDYLPKPFNRVILRARVGASLERKRLRDAERAYLAEIEAQRQRLDACLHAILPAPAVDELAANGRIAPHRYDGVAVMFADIIGFTAYCDCHAAEGVVAELDLFARGCERLAATHGLEKIKTVGDAVLLTGNLLLPHPEPVQACVACAGAMIEMAAELPGKWRVRAGIQLGPVVAGMVGEEKFGFDIWGDTVNLAARLSELTAEPGIHLGGAAAARVRGKVGLADLGRVTLKGTGGAKVFRVVQQPPEAG